MVPRRLPLLMAMKMHIRRWLHYANSKHGVTKPEQLKKFREEGGLSLTVYLTIDAESVFKSVTSRDLKTPAEKTLLGHVLWLRELLQLRLIESIQWCGTRDMTADGHTKGCIDRALLLDLMRGKQVYRHEVKRHTPHRGSMVLSAPLADPGDAIAQGTGLKL